MHINMNKWRNFLWPIQRGEHLKFFLMLIMFFLISLNYSLLRTTKDTMIITAKDSGAEAIPFIKVWFILPMALLMTYVFTRISNKFSREKLFYYIISIFLLFFICFTFFLYPAREHLHPIAFADKMQLLLPQGLKGFIALFRNWTYTSFYIMAELWSTTILTMLFWGFANEVTPVAQAKRFYGLLSIGANLATTLSGQISLNFSGLNFNPKIPYGTNSWDQYILFLNIAIICSSLIIIVIFRVLNKKIIHQEDLQKHRGAAAPKIKMSLRKNFSYLAKSKYLILLAVIVISYNLATNLIEIVWKNQLKLLYPNPADFNAYMSRVVTFMGILATFTAIFVSGNLLRKFSWTFSALIPPIIVLTTGIGFFSFFLMGHTGISGFTCFLGLSPLAINVFFGSLQNCIGRAAKYTLFDSTKEIAFIPLDYESRIKGKAAIDGVGSRLGKSGGGIIQLSLLMIFTTLTAATPYIAVIFMIAVVAWISSVKALGKRFNAQIAHNDRLSPEAAEQEPALVE